MPLDHIPPLLLLLLALSTSTGTPGATPAPTPEPIVLNHTLVIESYPAGEEPGIRPVADLGGPMQMTPGESRSLAVGTYACCYVFEPRDLDVIWTVSPVEGVTIDEEGLLTFDETVPDGTVFNVTANRDPAGQSAGIEVHVYAPDARPLVRLWRETAQLACDTGEEVPPMEPIGELRFDADGTFSVTWQPFEIYRDYWGTYRADPASGELMLRVEGGNIPTPPGFDGDGAYGIAADGSLVLRDIWLGSREVSPTGPGCGHVFAAR